MRTLISLAVLVASSSAFADGRFEVVDRGNAVEIIAHDVKAAKTTISPVRSRLEIPLVGSNNIPKLVPPSDKTIKVIELDGHSQQVLSVKLDFERPQVQQLAKHAQVFQVGNDVHMIVPRAIPAAGTTANLPEPTLTPELAAKAAAIAPIVDGPKPIETKPEVAKTEPKTEAKTEPKTEADHTAVAKTTETAPEMVPSTGPLIRKTEPAEAPKTDKPIGQKSDGPMKNFPILLACVLALAGCIVWVKRRGSNQPGAKERSTIEVIATKSLGGKNKIVWLTAGGRELIVSVSAQQVRMLGQWKKSERGERSERITVPKSEASVPRDFASVLAEGSQPRISRPNLPEATALQPSSPAVAGILKLRARTNMPELADDIATDDVEADEVWAREILAATGARK